MKTRHENELDRQIVTALLVALGFLLLFLKDNQDIFDALVLFVFGAKP